jgi:hypothetical protein
VGAAGFKSAFERGEPLADVEVTFRPGVDAVAATERLNALADDFDLHPRPHYRDGTRIGSATKRALERLFGWQIVRAPLPGGTSYWWKTLTEPHRYPDGCEALIESMGLDQPGADDDGQWYDWPEDSPRGDDRITAKST